MGDDAFRPDLGTVRDERERALRARLLRLQIRKAEQDMILENRRFILALGALIVATAGLAFTAGNFFKPGPTPAPNVIVLNADHGTNG